MRRLIAAIAIAVAIAPGVSGAQILPPAPNVPVASAPAAQAPSGPTDEMMGGSGPAAAPTQPSGSDGSVPAAGTFQPSDHFTISAGDVLDVSVLEDQSLNRSVLVQPDGKITLPIAGVMEVGGKTPLEVQTEVTTRLAKDFVTRPTVTVALHSVHQLGASAYHYVFVLGQVAHPGRFAYDPSQSLTTLQALALAGGPGPFAALRRIQVRRHDAAGKETLLNFNYRAVEDGRALPDALTLMDGDVVVVPERGLFE